MILGKHENHMENTFKKEKREITKDFGSVVLSGAKESGFLKAVLVILILSQICRTTVIIVNILQIVLPYL